MLKNKKIDLYLIYNFVDFCTMIVYYIQYIFFFQLSDDGNYIPKYNKLNNFIKKLLYEKFFNSFLKRKSYIFEMYVKIRFF